MFSLVRTAAATATAPARLTVQLALALPPVAAELSGLVRDVRILVGELAALSRDAPRGALADLVENLARLTAEDGELTVRLREQVRAGAAPAEEAPAPTRSATSGGRGSTAPGHAGRASTRSSGARSRRS